MKDMGVKISSASKRRAHSKKNNHPTEAMAKKQKTQYVIKLSKGYYDDMALQLMFKHIEYVVPDKREELGRAKKPLLACSIRYLKTVREHNKNITRRSKPGDKNVAKDLEPEEHWVAHLSDNRTVVIMENYFHEVNSDDEHISWHVIQKSVQYAEKM